MIFAIVVTIVIAWALGVPLLPLLVTGGVLQALTAYAITRNRSCLTMIMALACIGAPPYLLALIEGSGGVAGSSIFGIAAPWILGVCATIVLVLSSYIGKYAIRGTER